MSDPKAAGELYLEDARQRFCELRSQALVIMTSGDSYKVKRLRSHARVRLAGCDARGLVHGPWHEGRGRVIDDAGHAARAHAALKEKYGWQMLVLDGFSRASGRIARRAFLEITVETPS